MSFSRVGLVDAFNTVENLVSYSTEHDVHDKVHASGHGARQFFIPVPWPELQEFVTCCLGQAAWHLQCKALVLHL
jgi:hypothetical protein